MGLCCPHTLKHYSHRRPARRSNRACLLASSLVLITAMLNACVSATPVQEPTGPTGIVLEGIVIRNELLDPGIPAWLEVIVFAKGQAGAKLIQ
jgi:hypothetical protein